MKGVTTVTIERHNNIVEKLSKEYYDVLFELVSSVDAMKKRLEILEEVVEKSQGLTEDKNT